MADQDEQRLTGTYTTGAGKAHLNISSDEKRAEHRRLFGCPMVGTFNVELPPGERLRLQPFRSYGPDRFWLIRLRRDDRECYAYAVRWKGSRLRDDRLELLSKKPIPDHFKTGELEVTIFERWSDDQVERWQAELGNSTKWQGHAFWRPLRADSAFVWSHIESAASGFEGRTVLDIGCNAGYFAFRAAQRGAVVEAVDRNADILVLARTIQHHIEMTDIEFRRAPSDMALFAHDYNYIFYLSVHHQFDPIYERLERSLNVLSASHRCATLFVELINPPLAGGLSKEAVDAVVRGFGGRELAHYQHRVRRMRSLYAL